jgi:hypothetical protein
MSREPPPPDSSHSPVFVSETVVEIIYSSNGTKRAVLTRDRENLFRVRLERWDTSDWEFVQSAYWGPVGGSSTITDTIESARVLGNESLSG